MARVEKDVVSYFPHDARASIGDTLTILQNRFGNNGYAVWFKLLEKLASCDGHYLDCRNKMKWQLLIAYLGVDEITTVEILDLLVEIDAIDKGLWQSKLIWCQKLVDNVADVYKNRRRGKPSIPLITNKNEITTENNHITTNDNPQSKVKESKVNKRKVESTILLAGYHFEQLWLNTLRVDFKDIHFDQELVKFTDYYSDSKRKLKSPKLALRNWMLKEREIKATKGNNNRPGAAKGLATGEELEEAWQ